MEAEGDRFAVAVQWHPEASSDAGLFEGLVEAARGRTAGSEPQRA
jgi:putative glutamine amidotransferase